MIPFRIAMPFAAAALAGLLLLGGDAGARQQDKDKPKKDQTKLKKFAGTWTDREDKTLPVDYRYQGEYVGDKMGCQIIALDKGHFQAVVYAGGLPGDGWERKAGRSLLDGKLDGEKVTFAPATGKRGYKAPASRSSPPRRSSRPTATSRITPS